MQELVIEYRLEGYHRGYQFVTPTEHLGEEVTRAIWRHAMPRGHGWGDALYLGACSLKCFPVSPLWMALAESTVTDQQDEMGRRGIRRTVIQLMTVAECVAALRRRLENFLADLRAQPHNRPSLIQWNRVADRATGRARGKHQLLLTHAYQPSDWRYIEALVIKAALAGGTIIPFSTLSLDYRDELHIVAMPTAPSRGADGAVVFPVRFF